MMVHYEGREYGVVRGYFIWIKDFPAWGIVIFLVLWLLAFSLNWYWC